MDATFACPECGSELKLKGLSPGRQVQCGWCETWVEVPFLPRSPRARVSRVRRGRRQRLLVLSATWGIVGVLAVLILTVGTAHWFRSRARAAHEKALAELTASARADEQAGRIGPALATLEAAAALARASTEPNASEVVAEILSQRDQLSRRELKARIAAVSLPPTDADLRRVIGECLTLLARIEKEPEQADLEEEVRASLVQACRRSIAVDLANARSAAEAHRAAEAFQLCDRLTQTADHLPTLERRQAQGEAKELVARIVAHHGVVYDPIDGQFALGSIASYTSTLVPLLSDALRPRGYLPCPSGSSEWSPIWEKHAPYHVAIDLTERQGGMYQQSRNRISRIDARLTLTRDGVVIWQQALNGRTRPLLSKLTGYQAARVAVGEIQNPEIERLLYNDARVAFLERLGLVLRGVPECGASAEQPATPGAPAAAVPAEPGENAPLAAKAERQR